MERLKLPVGIEDFEEIRTDGFYFVDKTLMVSDLLKKRGKVNLFTRPRRFGKSLNMSMLKYFFEIGTNPALFDGLGISAKKDICQNHMGKYPVISISLKDVRGFDFENAMEQMRSVIGREAWRLYDLLDCERLGRVMNDKLNGLIEGRSTLEDSLSTLSDILFNYFGQKVIILIDEYDVPLQKAEMMGYYDQMTTFISNFFSSGMKTNASMAFAVITGCLRVAKESIFTGFNNVKTFTLLDNRCDEWFGFTDGEVRELLGAYGLDEYYETTRDWYDGYRVGEQDVYCPWDVINWCDQLLEETDKTPQNYWANVSGNDIIRRFVGMADETTKAELEQLADGICIEKRLRMDLTYREINRSIDNLWSVMFMTGYLTQRGRCDDGAYRLAIPNREVRMIFEDQIRDWFFEKVGEGLAPLYAAIDSGDAQKVNDILNGCLSESISFMDGGNSEAQKESFYHGLLLGLFKGCAKWIVKSNREAGGGRADIVLVERFKKVGTVIEVKSAASRPSLQPRAGEALEQILDKKYAEYFEDYDIRRINRYGIAFFRKECAVIGN